MDTEDAQGQMLIAWSVGHCRDRKRSTLAPGLMEMQQHGRKAPGRSQRTPNSSELPRALLTAHLSSQGIERSTKRPPYRCPRNPVRGNGPPAISQGPHQSPDSMRCWLPPEADKCCPLPLASFNNLFPGPCLFLLALPDPGTWEQGGEEGAWEGSGLPRLFKLIGGG